MRLGVETCLTRGPSGPFVIPGEANAVRVGFLSCAHEHQGPTGRHIEGHMARDSHVVDPRSIAGGWPDGTELCDGVTQFQTPAYSGGSVAPIPAKPVAHSGGSASDLPADLVAQLSAIEVRFHRRMRLRPARQHLRLKSCTLVQNAPRRWSRGRSGRPAARRTVSRRANAPPHLPSSSDDEPPLNRAALVRGAA
jgi:hypothetical protein